MKQNRQFCFHFANYSKQNSSLLKVNEKYYSKK